MWKTLQRGGRVFRRSLRQFGTNTNKSAPSVIDTACLIAKSREICPLIDDPFAAKLAGPEGKRLENILGSVPGSEFYYHGVGLRTILFDNFVSDFLGRGGEKQLVIMGAGMDSRAYRLESMKNDVTVFEVDFPKTFEMKRERLEGAKHLCKERIEIPLDIEKVNWDELLLKNGFSRDKQTIFTVEGLIMYLPQSVVDELFNKVSSLSTVGDVVVGDYMKNPGLTENLVKMNLPKQFEIVARLPHEFCNAPMISGVSSPGEFKKMLAQCELEVVEDLGNLAQKKKAREIYGKPFPDVVENAFRPTMNFETILWVVTKVLPGLLFDRSILDTYRYYKAVKMKSMLASESP